MIIAYHVIFTTYGTWLPNDPRGSYSTEIYKQELKCIAAIRYGRQNPQPCRQTLRKFWTVTKPRLAGPPFFIDENTRSIVADSFAKVVDRLNLHIGACAIMSDHVHVLVLRSKYKIEYVVNQLKGAATAAMKLDRKIWTRGY